VYNDDSSGYSDPGPSSSLGPTNDLAGAGQNVEASPGAPDSNPVASNVAESTAAVVLYLNDGKTYEVSDYWVADNQLHYISNHGSESTIDLDQVDLQRTVDENAKRGTQFTLKTNHSAPAASSDQIQQNQTTSASPGTKQNNGSDATPAKANPPAPPPQVKTTSQTQTQPQG
jgi:hypothetical protein